MRNYSELRVLSQQGSISGKQCDACQRLVVALASDSTEPSRGLDRELLNLASTQQDPIPLLALRCRVSHAFEGWLKNTYSRYGANYGLSLSEMAGYALDDIGEMKIRIDQNNEASFTLAQIQTMKKGLISPFSAEVIRSYDEHKCGLAHWARLKLQCHNDLKAYFRENGLLLISDWALLADSSAKRVRDSWDMFGTGALTSDKASTLVALYKPLYRDAMCIYRQRTGKSSGWQPDHAFLHSLCPTQSVVTTMEQLKSVSTAIRKLQSGSWQQGAAVDSELIDQTAAPEFDSDSDIDSADLHVMIDQALHRAMDLHMTPVMKAGGKHGNLLLCLWAGWAEGLTNRPLAERCCTSCGTVSKKLRVSEHANNIAVSAAVELCRLPAFSTCAQSVASAERLVAGLRNHLLESEREGAVAPLRQWIQQYLLHQ